MYAIADGEISFSGSKGGYGWLIIIDHPQANLYSLYGHLSPASLARDRLEIHSQTRTEISVAVTGIRTHTTAG